MHRRGVYHADLKPNNIMISKAGEVKILDFGLAATLDAAARVDPRGARPAGSFPYMSPEQAGREPLDARADVFTVGILLWEMLAGATLFHRDDDDETLSAVRAAEVPPPSSLVPSISPELDAACLKALARDREARFDSAAELLGVLTKFLYSADRAVTPLGLSKLVAELCPPVPRGAATPAKEMEEERKAGPATKPMSRRGTDEKTFATHAEFERVLAGNVDARHRNGLGPRASGFKIRKAIAISVLAGGLTVIAAAVVANREAVPTVVRAPIETPVVMQPTAIDAAVVVVPDGAVAPVGEGTLVVAAPGVAWAKIYVDGKLEGNTPKELTLGAGAHVVTVVCDAAVCPGGRRRSDRVVIPAGERVVHKVSLE
jgi:hypothetical protein